MKFVVNVESKCMNRSGLMILVFFLQLLIRVDWASGSLIGRRILCEDRLQPWIVLAEQVKLLLVLNSGAFRGLHAPYKMRYRIELSVSMKKGPDFWSGPSR